jgi:hypothetical protein
LLTCYLYAGLLLNEPVTNAPGRLVISARRFSARIATRFFTKKSLCSVLTSISSSVPRFFDT